jgi:hypothetical protein
MRLRSHEKYERGGGHTPVCDLRMISLLCLLSIQDGTCSFDLEAAPDLGPEAVPDLEFESIGFGEVKGGMDTSRSFGLLLPLLIKSKPPQSLLDATEAREALLREVSIAIIQY